MKLIVMNILIAISTLFIVFFFAVLKEIYKNPLLSFVGNAIVPLIILDIFLTKRLNKLIIVSIALYCLALTIFLVSGQLDPPPEFSQPQSVALGYTRGYAFGALAVMIFIWTPISAMISHVIWKKKFNKRPNYQYLLTSLVLLGISVIFALLR